MSRAELAKMRESLAAGVAVAVEGAGKARKAPGKPR
jgi:hypothetical protein